MLLALGQLAGVPKAWPAGHAEQAGSALPLCLACQTLHAGAAVHAESALCLYLACQTLRAAAAVHAAACVQ